jgi:hypothetical protein
LESLLKKIESSEATGFFRAKASGDPQSWINSALLLFFAPPSLPRAIAAVLLVCRATRLLECPCELMANCGWLLRRELHQGPECCRLCRFS